MKSKNILLLEPLEKHRFKLHKDFKFRGVTIHKDFETDLASVPRIFWTIIPPYGKYTKSAIKHDFNCFYAKSYEERKSADLEFREDLKFLGVRPLRVWLMYKAVSLNAYYNYKIKQRFINK